jgi:cardiolipin synthase
LVKAEGQGSVLVVNSEPSVGGSTRARILVQTLLAAATKSIIITTPYFLPDRSLRNELVRAIKERGVQVSILVPGTHSDHALTRSSSRRLFGDLLEAGASIYEYNPAMIHAKVLVVDGIWSVFGSTNFDSRSFGLNDEVNVAVQDAALAGELTQQFKNDLQQSTLVKYEHWKHRGLLEKGEEYLGMLIQRQE